MQIWCGFSRSKHIWAVGSKIIAESEKQPFSHAYIRYLCPITGENMIFQASRGLVNCSHIDNFLVDNLIVKEYEFDCSTEQFAEFYRFKVKALGKKYSKKQILWLCIKKLLHVHTWPNKIYDVIKNGESESICSETAALVCIILGIHIENNQLDQFSPSDLDKILANNNVLTSFNING